jgi:hypothetical protein
VQEKDESGQRSLERASLKREKEMAKKLMSLACYSAQERMQDACGVLRTDRVDIKRVSQVTSSPRPSMFMQAGEATKRLSRLRHASSVLFFKLRDRGLEKG